MKFEFFSDPGHGWIKVPGALLRELGIVDKITPYSYAAAGFGYLEEDCDASTFFVAYRERFGRNPELVKRVSATPAKIRNYSRFAPELVAARPAYAPGQLWRHPRTGELLELIEPAGQRRGWWCRRPDLADGVTYRAPFSTLAAFVFEGGQA